MENRNIEEKFNDVLDYIKDANLKKSLILILNEYLPDYWFHEGASSTGKYHPSYAQGDGGLMRHSKAAMMIGAEILGNPIFGDEFNDHEKDLLLVSLLIHDGLKYNFEKEKYTRFDHPILMSNYIMDNYKVWYLSKEDAEYMSRVIASHMGPWNISKYDKTVLPVPSTKEEKFVHLCDYLASRKTIEVPFDENSFIKKI